MTELFDYSLFDTPIAHEVINTESTCCDDADIIDGFKTCLTCGNILSTAILISDYERNMVYKRKAIYKRWTYFKYLLSLISLKKTIHTKLYCDAITTLTPLSFNSINQLRK